MSKSPTTASLVVAIRSVPSALLMDLTKAMRSSSWNTASHTFSSNLRIFRSKSPQKLRRWNSKRSDLSTEGEKSTTRSTGTKYRSKKPLMSWDKDLRPRNASWYTRRSSTSRAWFRSLNPSQGLFRADIRIWLKMRRNLPKQARFKIWPLSPNTSLKTTIRSSLLVLWTLSCHNYVKSLRARLIWSHWNNFWMALMLSVLKPLTSRSHNQKWMSTWRKWAVSGSQVPVPSVRRDSKLQRRFLLETNDFKPQLHSSYRSCRCKETT